MSGRMGAVAAALARGDAASDSGKWWVLCQRWSSWMEGESYCYTLTGRGHAQRRALWQRADRLKASRWIDATSKLSPPATEDKLARRNRQCLLVALSGHRDPVMRCPLLRSALDVSCQPCVINKGFKSMVFQYLAEHIPSNLRDARFPSSQSRRTLPFEQHRAQFCLGPFWWPRSRHALPIFSRVRFARRRLTRGEW